MNREGSGCYVVGPIQGLGIAKSRCTLHGEPPDSLIRATVKLFEDALSGHALEQDWKVGVLELKVCPECTASSESRLVDPLEWIAKPEGPMQ